MLSTNQKFDLEHTDRTDGWNPDFCHAIEGKKKLHSSQTTLIKTFKEGKMKEN